MGEAVSFLSTKESCNIPHGLDSHDSTERGSFKQGEQLQDS